MFRLWCFFYLRNGNYILKYCKHDYMAVFYLTPWKSKVMFRLFRNFDVKKTKVFSWNQAYKKISLLKFFNWRRYVNKKYS